MRRQAFTLVELLAATALSAMLMTVGFGVLRSIGRPMNASTLTPWVEPLASILRADMTHAVAVRADDDVVTLAGLNSIDSSTAAPSHRPATVTYRISKIGGTRWLVRQQASLDRSSSPTVDLMCANVADIRALMPPLPHAKGSKIGEDASTLAGDASLPRLFRQLVGFRAVPDRWQIIIDIDGRPTLVIAEAL